MHKGFATSALIKDTSTPELLHSLLRTSLDGYLSYGGCLALGQWAFNADQDRPLPYLLYNVVNAMAMRRGIATRTFIKDTVTPEMLLSKTLVGDLSYGECLAPGHLAF